MTENVKHVEVLQERLRKVRRLAEEYALVNEDARVLELRHEESATVVAIAALQREAAGDGERVDLFAKSVPTSYVRSHGQDIDLWVRLGDAEQAPRPTGTECPLGVECAKTSPEIHRCYREAEHANTDAGIGAAFLSVLSDPSVKWRDTGAQPFIDRVAKEAGTTAPPSAEPGEVEYRADFPHPSVWVWQEKNYTGEWLWKCSFNRRQLQDREKWVRNEKQIPEARGGGEAVHAREALALAVENLPEPGTLNHGWRDEEIWEWALREAAKLIRTHPTPAALDAEKVRTMVRDAIVDEVLSHPEDAVVDGPDFADAVLARFDAARAARATTGGES